MLSDMQRNARTTSCKMLSLIVKEISTDITKLETKNIRKTRSTANQFDENWLKRYKLKWDEMQTLGCNKLLFIKKNPTDNTKLETKIIRKTQSTANQFDAGTLTQAVQTKVERHAQTVSYNMLLLFVKEIPTDITKLETKIIKYSIHKKSISCRHIETRSWTRIETKLTQSQLKHYHCSSRDSYIHHETGTKNHNGGLNLRLRELMLGHRLKRCYPMCNEMHWHPAAKCYHCLSKRIQRTTQNWEQKSSERHNPQQINLMLRHWLKHYKLQTKVERNAQTVSNNMLTLFVKEIPTDITKLETKNIRKTRSTANQFDAEHWLKHYKLKWNDMHSQLQNGIIVRQRDSYGHHTTENKNHQILDPQKSISCRHIEPRSWISIETKFTQSQLKHYHCSSRDSYIHHETGTKNHNRGLNLRLSNLMLGHWLKRCHLMCSEMHGHSAAKCYHCLSKRFLRTSNNWKQKSQKDTIHRKSLSCSTLNHVLKKELKPNSRKVS